LRIFVSFIPWLVSFGVFYVVSLQAATSNQGLLDFHEVFFPVVKRFLGSLCRDCFV